MTCPYSGRRNRTTHPAAGCVGYKADGVNILPRGIDKGKGIEFLSNETGYLPSEMLGVGDSDLDLQFLSMVGYSAAPSNANHEVKQSVQYVSPQATSDGMRDILDHFELPC